MPPKPTAADKEGARLGAIQSIKDLLKKLPNLPKASKNGKIYSAIKPRDGDPWEIMNSRFDTLYGENLRDKTTGRLPNIEGGTYGLIAFANYLERSMALKGISANHEIIMLRLDRITAELQHYAYVPDNAVRHQCD